MTTPEFAEADLPEMPPYDRISHEAKCTRIFWDEASMRAYALAAVATYHEKLTEQQPVFEVGFGWLDDATKYPRGTKLYATSMLQDKPDGFIHPDNVRRLQSGETVAFRKKPYEHDGGGLPVYVGAKPQVNESEAMKALRNLIHAVDLYGSAGTGYELANARAVLAGEPGKKSEQLVEWQPLGRILGPGSKLNSLRIEPAEQPKQARAMDEREWFHIWFSGYIDPNSGPTERNVKRLPAWHGWQARAVLAQAQASGKHCPHPTECFDHTKGHLCDDCRDKPQAGEKAASTGELE